MRLIRPLALILAALAVASATLGCKSTGSREYVPGKGWRLIR